MHAALMTNKAFLLPKLLVANIAVKSRLTVVHIYHVLIKVRFFHKLYFTKQAWMWPLGKVNILLVLLHVRLLQKTLLAMFALEAECVRMNFLNMR